MFGELAMIAEVVMGLRGGEVTGSLATVVCGKDNFRKGWVEV